MYLHSCAIRVWQAGRVDRIPLKNRGISAELDRQLQLPSDVLCVRYNASKSASSLLLAVGLLDNTVRVCYEDSLKLFLTLYGHKLPVMSLDISYDSTILISGSADKTIKIWGMHFGDCHRSLYVHEDSVTCVQFQPNTHYFFSVGKDGVMKYWDADCFEQILYFPGHRGSIWHVLVSHDGSTVYTSGQDRSIRVWSRGDDLVFLEEEKERMLEASVEKTIGQDANVLNEIAKGIVSFAGNGTTGEESGQSLMALNPAFSIAKHNPDSLKGSELLIQAIDLMEEELPLYKQRQVLLDSNTKNTSLPPPNVLLLGLSPHQYLARTFKLVKSTELEAALLLLPYHYVKRLLVLLIEMVQYGIEMEVYIKLALFLIVCLQVVLLSLHFLVQFDSSIGKNTWQN